MRGCLKRRVRRLPLSLGSTAGIGFSVGLLALSGIASPAHADFSSCLAGLKQSALRAGIKPAIVAKALNMTEPVEKVLKASKVQPEFRTPIWDYLAYLVDDQRIRDGRAMMAKHASTLKAAEKRYGVNRYVIAAVWGVETDYGRTVGKSFLPHALATLSCRKGRRAKFWTKQLMATLKIVNRGDLKLEKLYGSWAGAFGQTQFMPSVYLRLAVDFDGDGKRDLVSSVPDALGSTANYLRRAGWRTGQSWLIEAKVNPGYSGPRGRRKWASLSTWAKRGVRRADGRALKGKARAGLILPAGPRGPAFLVFRNFNAIYAYNHAVSYALAISHLADRLAGGRAFRTAWPTDDPGLSRAQRLELQKLLIKKGYDVGEADGKIGSKTRAQIAKAEKDLGMKVTGRAGRKIYRALGGR